jgi:DNA-binding HxlR family transcriptional regulator
MTERKSYGQFCGLARALDRVGDRWTLLVVRELLLGDRTFRELADALDGISPSLLTKRLAELADDGLLVRNDAPRRSKSVEYRLTDAGRALEPVVLDLIRWGSRWMVQGPGGDRVDAGWAPLALRALLEGQPSRRGCVHLDIDGVEVTVESAGGRRHVTAGHRSRPDALVTAPLPVVLAVATEAVTLPDSGAAVSGDARVVQELLVRRGGT